jgi:hypothetical protein
MTSCFSYKNNINKIPCTFDRETMSIIGKDSVGYGCYNKSNIKNHVIIWLLNKTYKDGFDFNREDEVYYTSEIRNFSICNCKDTLWAKKQIIDEISRKYPFSLIDTFKHHFVYDVIFRDTSVLSPYIDRGGGMSHYSIDDKYTFFSPANYMEIIETGLRRDWPADHLKEIHFENISPRHLEYTIYDMTIPSKYSITYTGNMPAKQFIQEMRDSMGVDIILKREYLEPIKMVKFK